jgi:phage shock protein PspC (stress-responsive transcriptional regulator)
MTRVLAAASMTSSVMVSSWLIFRTRLIWGNRRSSGCGTPLRRLTKRARKLRKQDAPGGVASNKASGSGVCNGIAAAQGLSVAWARGLYVAISFLAGALLAPVGDGYPMLAVFGLSILVYLGLSVFLQPVATRAEYARLRAPHLER